MKNIFKRICFQLTGFVVFSLLLGLIFIYSCNLNPKPGEIQMDIKGEGPLVNKVVEVDSIESILQVGYGNMYIKHGNTQKVTIRAQQNILNHIGYKVDNHVFTWGFDQNLNILPGTDSIYFELELTRNIKDINLNGAGNIVVESPRQKTLQLELTGYGNILCYGIRTNECNVNISGTGLCQVYVSDTLSGVITGPGDLYYRGHPYVQVPLLGGGNLYDDN